MKDEITTIKVIRDRLKSIIPNTTSSPNYKTLTEDDLKSLMYDVFKNPHTGSNPNLGTGIQGIRTPNPQPIVYGTGVAWSSQPFQGVRQNVSYYHAIDPFSNLHLTEEQYREYKKIVMQFEDLINENKLIWMTWKEK